MTSLRAIRVLLADDHHWFLKALKALSRRLIISKLSELQLMGIKRSKNLIPPVLMLWSWI